MGAKDKTKASTDKIVDAIQESGGNVSTIAVRLAVNWQTAKRYISTIPEAKLAYEAEIEGLLDLAEDQLTLAIRRGDLGAIKFYLQTKGRRRGYGDHTTLAFDKSFDVLFVDKDPDDEV